MSEKYQNYLNKCRTWKELNLFFRELGYQHFDGQRIFTQKIFSFPTQPEAFPDSTGIEEDEPGAIFERFEIIAASRRLQMMSERKREREKARESERECERAKGRERERVCVQEMESEKKCKRERV